LPLLRIGHDRPRVRRGQDKRLSRCVPCRSGLEVRDHVRDFSWGIDAGKTLSHPVCEAAKSAPGRLKFGLILWLQGFVARSARHLRPTSGAAGDVRSAASSEHRERESNVFITNGPRRGLFDSGAPALLKRGWE
jgi:hypothetical protein